MERKILCLILLFCILLVYTTGCNKKENNEKYINLLNDYTKDFEFLNNQTFPAEYNKTSYELYSINASGNISTVLYDLNNDNNYKSLCFDFDSNQSIKVTLLSIENNEIKNLDYQTLLNTLPALDEFKITLFALKLNNAPYFFLEINGSSSLLSNGMYFELYSITIANNKLVISSPIKYEASVLDTTEVNDYINKVKKTGLSMETINESIFAQNSNAIKIFEINRKHLDSFLDKNTDTIQYGETTFKDYLYKKYIIEFDITKNKQI